MYPYDNQPPQNASYQPSYAPVPVTPPAPQRPDRPSRSSRGMVAGILCASLVTSALAGFGGGYLALSMHGNSLQSANGSGGALTAPQSTGQPEESPAPSGKVMSVSEVVNAVSDSVVEITTKVTASGGFMMQQYTGQSAGSGVIISEDGYIITNNHVIEGAQSITVRLKNGESYEATLVGADAQTDVAVIKIEAEGLSAATMGSSSSLQVGDDAIAIGNPLGELGGTVTNGIISATSREVTLDNQTMTLLQTNAAINRGNSGGGLFNSRGELIGIVVAKTSGEGVEGLGFAIPIDVAKEVAGDLIDSGYVTGRGELGVSVINIADEYEAFAYRVAQPGVYVAAVQENSAAQRAGIEVGDGILAVGDKEVSTSSQLTSALGSYAAGDAVELTLLRGSEEKKVTVTLQEKIPEELKQASVAT